MQAKTAGLTGAALDWAVAKALGRTDVRVDDDGELVGSDDFDYTTDWRLAGPIIERENITLVCCEGDWVSDVGYLKFWVAEIGLHTADGQYGPQGDYWGSYYEVPEDAIYGLTPLVAAMRCFVASKLGDFVEVPDELA